MLTHIGIGIASPLVMAAIIAFFVFIAILTAIGTLIVKAIDASHRNRSVALDSNRQPAATDPLPFQRRKYFFSAAERSFYEVMRRMIPTYTVFAKVRLADVVYAQKSGREWRAHQNRIDRKHLDFVICDPDLAPVVAVELDDSSHQRPDRIERDSAVDQILSAAGLPIVRVPAQRGYQLGALRKLLSPYLDFKNDR